MQIDDAIGTAALAFRWDATAVASAVCGDFKVNESFSATVASRTYDLDGHLRVMAATDRVVLTPEFSQRLFVRPEPTAASWARVREILDRHNNIFRCGLALNPDDMERKIRELLHRGFGFQLPNSILQPIALPATVSEHIEVGGNPLQVSAVLAGIKLRSDWLWYGIEIELTTS